MNDPALRNVQMRYRNCAECGRVLNVTTLFALRQYRCAHCGAVFRHYPDLSQTTLPEPKAEAPFAVRMLLAGIVSAGAVAAVAAVGHFEIERIVLAVVAGGTALASMLLTFLARRVARDSKGFSAGLMLSIAMGSLVAWFIADNVPLERQHAATFALIVFFAIGGVSLSRFSRNLSLPSVDEQGLTNRPLSTVAVGQDSQDQDS